MDYSNSAVYPNLISLSCLVVLEKRYRIGMSGHFLQSFTFDSTYLFPSLEYQMDAQSASLVPYLDLLIDKWYQKLLWMRVTESLDVFVTLWLPA